MAVNIFDKYGIKQVANVYFEALEADEASGVYQGDIVLFLDTLKVSTIETTAENTAAQGGWGNPRLISWDYGKEINITLEDALVSLESLRFMLGGAIKRSKSGEAVLVRHTEEVIVGSDGKIPAPKDHLTKQTILPKAWKDHPVRLINLGNTTGSASASAGTRTQIVRDAATTPTEVMSESGNTLTFSNTAAGVSSVAPVAGDHIRIFWEDLVTAPDAAVEVTISPSTFPGTYRVVGDTFIRSEKTGKDEAFQFVINKAKVQSEVTITLEAEGDPSTFEMQLQVLRSAGDEGDEMMKLIRYGGASAGASASGNDVGSLTAGS